MKQPHYLLALVLASIGVGVVTAQSPAKPPLVGPIDYERYDDHFRKYTDRYFGHGFDWRLFKAQAIVESNMRPNAVSSSGARGIMQMMSTTYAAARKANKEFGADMTNAEWNIAAGIWYAHEQWSAWEDNAEKKFHRQFMLGSYNAGRATLVRAQKQAISEKLNERRWPSIERVAPRVPNWRYKETLAYVGSVFANMSSLDRKGHVKGPTISKDENGGGLPDKLKHFLGLFKHLKLWDDD
jgi:membrane-bound lytic murein transglycosylase F